MQHKFLRLFVDGVWTGKADRTITVQEGKDVVKYDLDEYAKEYADMGSTQSKGSAKES